MRRQRRPPRGRWWGLALTLTAVVALAVLASPGADDVSSSRKAARAPAPALAERRTPVPAPSPYEPARGEVQRDVKRVAGRAAQRLSTLSDGETPAEAATSAARAAGGSPPVAAARRLHRGRRQSHAKVVYAQMGGLRRTSASVMVVVRQSDPERLRPSLTRVIDVRLRRARGKWRLDRIASVGGDPVPRPASLPALARAVLDNPRITLPDSARWDIHRGAIDPQLLAVMARIARTTRFSVAVLSSGHPHNVFQTSRKSAHTRGMAVDIYAVSGRRVVAQRGEGSPARALATRLLADGAHQVGSPWVLPPGPPRSFSDPVHQDHIHLQQRRPPPGT
jgi:hypothetical protein